MSRHWGKKIDANHGEIRADFRAAGWPWADLHRLGQGMPDGMVLSPKGRVYLIEVKTLEGKRAPKASRSAKPATRKAQATFADFWPVYVVTSTESAGALRERIVAEE